MMVVIIENVISLAALVLLGRVTVGIYRSLKAVVRRNRQEDVDGDKISHAFRCECIEVLKWTGILVIIGILASIFT